MSGKKKLIIIDSNSIIHRAYHALPPLTTKKGEVVNAVYGFLLVFFKIIKELRPDYIAACFDYPAPTFRHKKFKEYKAKRPPAPRELYSQMPIVKEILKSFLVPVFEKEGFEADDIIGTISRLSSSPGTEVVIVSGDMDALQLIDSVAKVYFLKKGVKDIVLYDRKAVTDKYQGLVPEQLVDFKALRGDPSDNIPGVKGIGEKTAINLIKEFGSFDLLYGEIEGKSEKADKIKPKVKELLISQKEQALLSRSLAKIESRAPIEFDLGKCIFGKYDKGRVVEALEGLGFQSLIKKIPDLGVPLRENLSLW